MSQKTLLTQAGFDNMEAELKELTTVRRKEIADKLSDAIAQGDLSENAEYDAAKAEQAFTEARIAELEEAIKTAEIIDESKAKKGVIQLGNTVELEIDGGSHSYTIVGTTEADAMSHRISNESPLGAALLGKEKGDQVTIDGQGPAKGTQFVYTIKKVG